MERNKVFISYSHKDDTWLEGLQVHLKPLERSGVVDRWDDTRLGAGADWQEEIANALARARVAVLLVSKYFLASDFIAKEELPVLLTAARSEGATILPVLVGPCKLPPELARFQAVNPPERTLAEMTEPEQDRVWLDLLAAIETSLAKLATPPARSIFASCCSEDLAAAEAVVEALSEQGLDLSLETWASGEEEGAGLRFQEKLEESQAALLLIGSRGLGPWTRPDLRDALEQRVRSHRQVLSVLLPEVPDFPREMPSFLARNTWIKLSRGIDEKTLGRISMGLTGIKPEPPTARSADPDGSRAHVRSIQDQDPVEKSLGRLVPLLRSRNVTILLGKRAAEKKPDFPPRPCELARSLLDSLIGLELIDLKYQHLQLPLDVVGSYYAAGTDETNLEIEVNHLIGLRSRQVPPVHAQIAELLPLLESSPSNHGRLIISTGFDLLIERALLRAGVAFTRVVQHWSGDRIDVNEYQKVERKGGIQISHQSYQASLVAADDDAALDREISGFAHLQLDRAKDPGYNLNEFKGPILYKLHGSRDVENSCAITAEQHLQLSKRLLPTRITAHTASGPVLVLGHGLLDPDFRLACNMLLETGRRDCRYAVLPSPDLESDDDDRRIEINLWQGIKMRALNQFGIETIESSGKEFLDQLIDRLPRTGA